MEQLLTYAEAAAELGISVRSLRELVRKGCAPFYKLGHRTILFRRSEIERALKKRLVKEV